MQATRKKKCVTLRGKRKRMQARCPHCGGAKVLEARKDGNGWRVCGVIELTKATPQP